MILAKICLGPGNHCCLVDPGAFSLKPGDRVIVEGMQKVRPGASVKAVPFDAGQKDGSGAVKTPQLPAKVH